MPNRLAAWREARDHRCRVWRPLLDGLFQTCEFCGAVQLTPEPDDDDDDEQRPETD